MSFKDDFRLGNEFPGSQSVGDADWMVYRAMPVFLGVIFCSVVFWPVQAATYAQEGGLVETISAIALLTAAGMAHVRYPGLRRLYIALGCFLLAERELDSEMYAAGSVVHVVLSNLDDVLDMTSVRIALALFLLGSAAWHGVPAVRKAWKQRAPFLGIFILSGMAAIVAQLMEEVSGIYEAELSVAMTARLFALEETLEMFFSIGILASVLIGWPKSQTEEAFDDQEPNFNTR